MNNWNLQTLVLAQETPPADAGTALPPPGQGEATTAAPDGSTAAGGGTGRSDPFSGMFFPMLMLILVMMITFTMLGQRRDKKKRKALLGAVKKHDRIQTVGGVIGSVVEIKTDTVVLKVDETSNTRITFARSAVQQVLTTADDDE